MPGLELSTDRVRLPVAADRWAEELSDLTPAVPKRPSCEREHGADVDIPERSREPFRYAELESCHDARGSHDTCELDERRLRVVDVAEEIRERQVIERAVLERERVCRRLDELDALAEAATCDGEHLRALVQPGHVESTPQELGRDESGARGDVQHVPAGWEPGHEEATPARILAERENRAYAVVRRPQGSEELSGLHGGHDPYSGGVALTDELERIAALVTAHAPAGDEVSGIIATEPTAGRRVYLCSYDDADGLRSWLAVREDGVPVDSREELREAVSIAAICEVAVDAAGGGDVEALIASLAELREREAPEGIDAAEEAARALQAALGDPPQLATPARLDEIGTATRRLERELDPGGASPFAAAMKTAQGAVAELQREIEAGYRLDLV